MDFLERMERAVAYVEAHLAEDFAYADAAAHLGCGAYQFSQVFACVAGVPLAAYIRMRRLSRAALALQRGGVRVIDAALEGGYESPEAFARAFRQFHGVSPREACVPGVPLKLYPRLCLRTTVKGDETMDYRFETMDAIHAVGRVYDLGRWTANTQAEDWQERSGTRWQAWADFLGETNRRIRDDYRLYRPPLWQLGVTQTLPDGRVTTSIGAQADGRAVPGLDSFTVPAATWAVFTCRGALSEPEHPVERALTQVLSQWLPESGCELASDLQMEVYGPGDTGAADYVCELWLPVRRR